MSEKPDTAQGTCVAVSTAGASAATGCARGPRGDATSPRRVCLPAPRQAPWYGVSLLLAVYTIAACAPLDRHAAIAAGAGWATSTFEWQGLALRSYSSNAGAATNRVLHVYIGGDGRPWRQGRYPAADPSGHNPLVLELMRADPDPALYLGRPCYHGTVDAPACEPRLWTFERYSPRVVAAMSAALESHIDTWRPRAVLLVGYSGGGVLALAVAARLQLPAFVVTIAGNLDVDAWTDHHGYLALRGSLDPADNPARFAAIPQMHLQGGRDRVVPPATTARYTRALPPSALRRVDNADHRCCWAQHWRTLLLEAPWGDIRARRPAADPG